jgi:hypothetical protein
MADGGDDSEVMMWNEKKKAKPFTRDNRAIASGIGD